MCDYVTPKIYVMETYYAAKEEVFTSLSKELLAIFLA
jgi:hypothetical protein